MYINHVIHKLEHIFNLIVDDGFCVSVSCFPSNCHTETVRKENAPNTLLVTNA